MPFSPFGCIYQPTSPCPTLSTHTEPISKDMAGSDITNCLAQTCYSCTTGDADIGGLIELILSCAETLHVFLKTRLLIPTKYIDLFYKSQGCLEPVDWTTGLDYWTGILDWNTGLEYWTGILEWPKLL